MKKTKISIILNPVFSIFLFFTACESDSRKKLGEGHDFGVNDESVVVAMGDSITAGGFSGGDPWPRRFARLSGKQVVNDGIRGASSPVGAMRIDSIIDNYRPGFIIIFYGANDAITGKSADTTETSLRKMISTAKTNQCIPIIANVLPISGSRSIYNQRVLEINVLIKQIAKEENIKMVNLYDEIKDNPDYFLVDGLHLNEYGEELIAIKFYEALN